MQRVIRGGAKKVGVHQQTLCTLCKCHTAGRAEQRWHDGVSVLANVILQRHLLIRHNTLWLAFPSTFQSQSIVTKKKLQLMKLRPSGQCTILCTTAVCNLARCSCCRKHAILETARQSTARYTYTRSACGVCMPAIMHGHSLTRARTQIHTHSLKVTRLYEQCKGITTEGNKKKISFCVGVVVVVVLSVVHPNCLCPASVHMNDPQPLFTPWQ